MKMNFLREGVHLLVKSWRYFYCVAAAADGIKSLRSKAELSDIVNMTDKIKYNTD